MIDLNDLESLREGNRLEAKKAWGGLPESIWETYSAFANTFGGVILLGVEEWADRSLHPHGVYDAGFMKDELWRRLNDRRVVSVNLLSKKDIEIHSLEGRDIILVKIPAAPAQNKPVYIYEDRQNGSYRRSGEGDYRCTAKEIARMLPKSADYE